jgi:hypothetical protein
MSCWQASGTNKVCLPLFHWRRARMTGNTHRIQTQLYAVGSLWNGIHRHGPSAVYSVCLALHQSHNRKS